MHTHCPPPRAHLWVREGLDFGNGAGEEGGKLHARGKDADEFRSADDQIEVSASGFGGSLVAGQTVSLVQGLVATHAVAEFMFDRASGVLGWDADGTGAGATVVVAHFTSTTPLTVTDFSIIA